MNFTKPALILEAFVEHLLVCGVRPHEIGEWRAELSLLPKSRLVGYCGGRDRESSRRERELPWQSLGRSC